MEVKKRAKEILPNEMERNWKAVLLSITLFFNSLSIGFEFLNSGLHRIVSDNALFQYGGWYITQGAIPYIDFWDVKPPLIYYLTSILSLISQGNMFVLHILSIVVTVIAATGTILLIGCLIYKLTENGWASLIAGLVMLSIPGFYGLLSLGTRPKYFVMFFGLLAIWLYNKNYKFFSGVSSVISAGFWQFGIIFPIIVFGLLYHEDWRKRKIKLTVTGMAITVAAVLLPIFFLKAFIPMLVEVILAPLNSPESQSVLYRFFKGGVVLRLTSILVLVGAVGLIKGIKDIRKTWWVLLGGTWFALQVFHFDFDGLPDLFLGLVFVAFGVGLAANSISRQKQKVLFMGLILIILTNAFLLPLVFDKGQSTQSSVNITSISLELEPNIEETRFFTKQNPKTYLEKIYWNKTKVESCHVRLSSVEKDWINHTNQSYDQEKCGNYKRLPWWCSVFKST